MWSEVLLMCLAFRASVSQIVGYGNVSADYGSEAHYQCKLPDYKDVLQVTWQRISEDSPIENLATYSKRFGEQVNDPYLGKIQFTEASLQSTSIIVRNLTWADESCYVCTFNAYPGGSKRHQTCLRVQGVSEVKTEVYSPVDDPKEKNKKVILNCAATGKPTPKIQWVHLYDLGVVEQSGTTVLTNADHTLTSSRNITLLLPPDGDGHVDCLINPGMRGANRKTITFPGNKEKTQNETHLMAVVVAVVVSSVIVCAVLYAGVLLQKSKRLRPLTTSVYML